MKRGQKASAEQVVLTLRQIKVQTAQGKGIGTLTQNTAFFGQAARRCSVRFQWFSRPPAREEILQKDLCSVDVKCCVTYPDGVHRRAAAAARCRRSETPRAR